MVRGGGRAERETWSELKWFSVQHTALCCVCSSSLPTAGGGGGPHSRRLFSPCCSFEGEKKRLLLSFVQKALVFLPFRDAENRRIGREEVFFVGKEVGAQLSIVKRENEENLRFALLAGITEGTFVCTQEQLGQLPMCSTSSTPNRCF